MSKKSLSRSEMKQVIGGLFSCEACASYCLYDPFGGPGAGCPQGTICVPKDCPSMQPFCPLYEDYKYYTVCE